MQKKVAFPLHDLYEVITVGFPFCGFKIISGMALASFGNFLITKLFAQLLIGLGLIDLVINLVNFVGLVLVRHRLWRICLLDFLLNPKWTWRDLGLSADVMLSFSLVAFMIGDGFLKKISPDQLSAWNICVILNVIGAGLNRTANSFKNRDLKQNN